MLKLKKYFFKKSVGLWKYNFTWLLNMAVTSFFNSLSGGWSPTGSTGHGGHWLAYCSLPRAIMMLENLVEWRLEGETEVLGENSPQTWARTRAAAVGSQRLTAWAIARPDFLVTREHRFGKISRIPDVGQSPKPSDFVCYTSVRTR
jgi:hypothetical protein